jgi:oxygen-independent coproporphyrinogen-3 oxidase
MHEWIGLGPSAASQHAGWRGGNVADLDQWRANIARRERVTEDRVALTPSLLAEDALIFGVRMNAGVDLAVLRSRFVSAPWEAVDVEIARLSEAGVAEVRNGHLRLTSRGRLIADTVGAELMQAFADAATT